MKDTNAIREVQEDRKILSEQPIKTEDGSIFASDHDENIHVSTNGILDRPGGSKFILCPGEWIRFKRLMREYFRQEDESKTMKE